VTHVGTWARIVYSDHIIIRGCNLSNATGGGGSRGGIRFEHSNYNTISNNTIGGGSDNIGLIHSDRNLIEANNITSGRHTLWTIHAGNFNVIRNNYFYNAIQKIGEIFDASSDPPIMYNATKYNLVEHNIFAYTPGSSYAGIQYAGQNGIIRNNVFYDGQGVGLAMACYPDEALWNTYNRVYHNVFYNNTGGGIETGYSNPLYPEYHFLDNMFKNNILYKNHPGPEVWNDNLPGGSQITHRRMVGFVFTNNNIINETPGENDVIWRNTGPTLISLVTAETNYPSLYVNNKEVVPGFIDTESYNFHLNSSSPMIDAGTFLTKTVGVGSGTSMAVEDATYFCDGFGIEGEKGDVIQLKGDTKTARIIGIDYANNTLTLDQPLSWTVDQGVSLAYNGSAPDIGAYEYVEGALPIIGDVNDDSAVNALDVQACVNHILGTQDWAGKADVNKDSAINSLDIQAIVNIILEG
jgi:hypothetical protein